jgi:hypothetical protein
MFLAVEMRDAASIKKNKMAGEATGHGVEAGKATSNGTGSW